jgi:hypothetical protein
MWGPRATAIAAIVCLAVAGELVGGALPTAPPGASVGPAAPSAAGGCEGRWNSTHLLVSTGSCQMEFWVMWAESLENWDASRSFNLSFAIGGIAEIGPSDILVRYADLFAPFAGTASATTIGPEVNLSMLETVNVSEASGRWTASDFIPAGLGTPTTNVSLGASTGVVNVRAILHLAPAVGPLNYTTGAPNATNGTLAPAPSTGLPLSNGLKLDIAIDGWPWADPIDHLALWMSALAPGGGHFSYDPGDRNLTERWNASDQPIASLVLDPNATGTSANGTGGVQVSSQATIYAAGSPGRGAVLLVNFTGGPAGYTALLYDPWVIFSIPAGSNSPAPVGLLLEGPVLAALIGGVLFVLIMSVLAVRARRTPPTDGLRPA